MARRKKGNPVHGWVILDKGPGMTSTQAVGKVRWLYQAQKAGHAGTLDPLYVPAGSADGGAKLPSPPSRYSHLYGGGGSEA